ncbi:MAG TPA: thioredoxin family protein [Chthoniobacterales bacterium]|nr:thioredoxin family protein [Chthoniobacterales bacterium]
MRIRRFSCLVVGFLFVATIARGAAEWQTDYEQALAAAKGAGKCVLIDFTGSDWCPPCIQMHKIVFSSAAFLSYAQKNLILVEVDYPRRKTLPENVVRQNERLLRQYEIDGKGFPTVVLLGPDGKMLGELQGYGGQEPAEIIAWVEKLCTR